MTLTVRNNFFKGGMAIAALSLGFVVLGGYLTFSALPQAAASAAYRSGGVILALFTNHIAASDYAPYIAILGAVIYSLTSIILILYKYEKTQSPEIIFIGFFVISLSFEFAKLIVPLRELYFLPSIYTIFASRVLLFGRYFGLFSLFAAGVYAAGLDMQKQQNACFLLILAALIIAVNVPVNILVWDTSFEIKNGYGPMLATVETCVFVVTIVTFLISAYTRGSVVFVNIGAGIFVAYAGRNILLASDNWYTLITGLLALTVGTWYTCIRLHREYLWL